MPNAVYVLDRFHVMKKFNEALDEIRHDATHQLQPMVNELVSGSLADAL